MNLQVIFFLLTVFVSNLLLYLSFNFDNRISYLILTLFICLNFYLYKRQKKNYEQPKKEVSAEDHPIIKAARERLKK